MAVLFVLTVAAIGLLVLACCKASGDYAEEERRSRTESPCESCLRWAECNGVDEQCPHKEVK